MRNYRNEFINRIIEVAEEEKKLYITRLMNETKGFLDTDLHNRTKLKEILAACDEIEALDIASIIRQEVVNVENTTNLEYHYGDVWAEGYLEKEGAVVLTRGGIFKKARGRNLKYNVVKWRDRIFEMRETNAVSSPIIKNFSGNVVIDSLQDAISVLQGQNCITSNEVILTQLQETGASDGWKIVKGK